MRKPQEYLKRACIEEYGPEKGWEYASIAGTKSVLKALELQAADYEKEMIKRRVFYLWGIEKGLPCLEGRPVMRGGIILEEKDLFEEFINDKEFWDEAGEKLLAQFREKGWGND